MKNCFHQLKIDLTFTTGDVCSVSEEDLCSEFTLSHETRLGTRLCSDSIQNSSVSPRSVPHSQTKSWYLLTNPNSGHACKNRPETRKHELFALPELVCFDTQCLWSKNHTINKEQKSPSISHSETHSVAELKQCNWKQTQTIFLFDIHALSIRLIIFVYVHYMWAKCWTKTVNTKSTENLR